MVDVYNYLIVDSKYRLKLVKCENSEANFIDL